MANFADRRMDYASQDAQNRRLARLAREARKLDRGRAIQLAAGILSAVLDDGLDAADLVAPQYATKQVRAASRALREIS